MNVVVIGAGMCGALTGMLLADDGHAVTVLERDAATPPDDPTEAWNGWERRSVRQFHMGHFFLPRFRLELIENLPRVAEALAGNGALAFNPMDGMPESVSGGWRADDDRFEALTGRRPMVEAVVARCAQETDGLTIRRGVVVTKLITARSHGTAAFPRPRGRRRDRGR